MKPHRILMSLLGLGIAPLAHAAQVKNAQTAETGKKDNAAEWADLFGGASLPVVWQSANAAATKIAAAIAAKHFDGVPDWAETVHLAAHALEEQVRLDDPERQKRLKGALDQAARLADEVMEAANHKEPEKLAESFRRMNAALKLAATRLPKEIIAAPSQEVRFATAAGQAHEKAEELPKK